MKKTFTITSTITELGSANELNAEEKNLLSVAKKATKSAYAPYSNFFVGAAILLDDGTIVTGNNQENVAFPSGLCAERVALFTAGAQYPHKRIKTIAVTATTKKFILNKPISPCGDCRQVMAESEDRNQKNIRIILAGETGKVYIVDSVKDLLPLMFSGKGLRKA